MSCAHYKAHCFWYNVAQEYVQYRRILIQYFIAVISYCSFSQMGILLNLLPLFIVLVLFKVSTSDHLPAATFVFGDSLVDVGNNNYLISFSKANYVPNGIDFGRPTGRFTNGRTIVDIIGKIYHYIITSYGFLHFYFLLIYIFLMTFSCCTRSGIGYGFNPTLFGTHHSWTSDSEGC